MDARASPPHSKATSLPLPGSQSEISTQLSEEGRCQHGTALTLHPLLPPCCVLRPPGCYGGDPRPPVPWARVVVEQDLCQEHPHCRDCHTPAFAAQALPCPTSAGGCPRARAVLARCPVAPLDPHPAEVMAVSARMLPQPRASVSPILPQPFHGAQPARPAPGASQPHTGTPPPIPIPCPAETTCPWPLASPSWAAWGSPAPCWALQNPTVGLSPPRPHPSWGLPLPPSPGPQDWGWLPLCV